jgi:hypothetical protein
MFVMPLAAGLNFDVVKELLLQTFNDGLWDYLRSSY